MWECVWDELLEDCSVGRPQPPHQLLGVLSKTFSTPPVHASFSQDSILFYPKTLSRFNDKGIWASYFFKWQKVEICKLMARFIEVVTHPCVKVVSYGCPVLCAPVSSWPCGAHSPHISGWFSLTGSSSMRTGDIVGHVGVVTGDPLFHRPGLVGQGAGVRPWVAWIDAAKTSCLHTLLESRLQPTTGSLSPVNCW